MYLVIYLAIGENTANAVQPKTTRNILVSEQTGLSTHGRKEECIPWATVGCLPIIGFGFVLSDLGSV